MDVDSMDLSSVKMEYDMFLNFKTKGRAADFLAFKSRTRNNPLALTFLVIMFLVDVARGVLFNDIQALVTTNPVFRVYIPYLQSLLIVFFVPTMFLAFAPKQSAFVKKWNGTTAQYIFDTCILLGGLVPSFLLIGRVVQGTCASDTSLRHSQVCNTYGAMNEIPMDTLIAAVIYNIAFQVFLRAFSPAALFGLWIVNIGLINVALFIVGCPLMLYTNLYLFMFALTSYEIERGMMQMYVNKKIALESAEANAKLKLELVSAQIKEENRALDSKREMVRHIAHEIRTPLNIVTVATDIILAELNKIESVPLFVFDTLNSCQEACAISIDIVNDLLNFEKLAAGLVTLEKMPTVLSTYIQRVLNPFYVSAGAKDIMVDYQYTLVQNGQNVVVDNPENVADVVEIDSVKMSSVLRNLLSNAIKFAKETIIVKVSVVRKVEAKNGTSNDDQACSSGHAIISVKDDGAGISSGNLSRLFQEGVQFNANELQKGGGSDFGLYIAKGIVDLHTDSRMWAESEGEGKGATFFVKLPLSNVVLPPPPSFAIDFALPITPVAKLDESSSSVNHGNQRESILSDAGSSLMSSKPMLVILVVDDSVFTRRLTIQLLKLICEDTHTCSFIEAVDGQDAVAFITQSLVAPTLHFTHHRLVSSKPPGTNGTPQFSGNATPSQTPRSSRIPNQTPRSAHVSLTNSVTNSRKNSLIMDKNAYVRFNGNGSNSRDSMVSIETESTATAQIDIVFMDYNMPRMTGPVATAEMRRWGYTGPIIGLSGDTDIDAFLQAGANAALVKPINKVQMEGVLHQHVSSWSSNERLTNALSALTAISEKVN